MATHICGQCNQQFTSEEEYLIHKCATTGFTPKEPDHLGPEFKAISEAAVARGEARRNEESHPAENPAPEPESEPLVRSFEESSLVSAVKAAKRIRKPNDADENIE